MVNIVEPAISLDAIQIGIALGAILGLLKVGGMGIDQYRNGRNKETGRNPGPITVDSNLLRVHGEDIAVVKTEVKALKEGQVKLFDMVQCTDRKVGEIKVILLQRKG